MQTLSDIIASIASFLWGWPLIILLLGTHIYLTVRLRFPQLKIFKAIRLSVTKDKTDHGDVSQFGALATALAATIGTGNIVGVATAITLGGPGAVLWCWLTGVFGMATKYSEALLAVKYRVKIKKDGHILGGPMYALERGLKAKWLGVLFAIFAVVASFGIGNMVQSNAISMLLDENLHIPPVASGIVITILTALVVLFGIKGISKVCTWLVPFMALFYIIGCIVILCINFEYLGETIRVIVTSAFSPQAAGGGFVGSTIMTACRFGIARGLFSNESGLGSAPIAAAAAQTRNPVRQALVSSTGTFWDTVVVCAMTGLVLVSCVIAPNGIDSASETLTSQAFGVIPVVGPIILSVGIVTFAFSTILGWSYYGERCIEYLGGRRATIVYRILFIAGVFVGAVANLSIVWNLADMMNALMAIPNLISLLLLSGVLVRETRYWLWEKRLDEYSKDEVPVIDK